MNLWAIVGISIAAILAVTMITQAPIQETEAAKGGPFTSIEQVMLDGTLTSGDFILLADITPFSSITGHVAIKVPCDGVGTSSVWLLAGVAPAVVNQTLGFVGPLSSPGTTCLYHADLPSGITDVALINPSVAMGGSGASVVLTEPTHHATVTINGQ